MKREQRKMERIQNINYARSRLAEGEEWYVGNGEFLTLQQTKKHLLEKMDWIKATLKVAQMFSDSFNGLINEAEISGHLYEDTFELAEILSVMRQLSEEFFVAFQEFEDHEFNMRQSLLKKGNDDELPF